MIKEVNCLRFAYDCTTKATEFVLESTVKFTAQSPKDETIPERAIVVNFSAHGDEEKFRLGCVCRVIFTFASINEVVEGKELVQLHQNDAYKAMVELTNKLLITMGQNELNFPEIDFDN